MGRDKSVLAYRYGDYVDKFEKFHGSGEANHMEVTGNAVAGVKRNTNTFTGRYPQLFIDTIGEGAPIISRLKEINDEKPPKGERKIPIYYHSVKASEAAEKNGTPLTDSTGEYRFLNMRAWLHWAVRDWLNPDNKNEAMLPDDEEFLEEATEIKWLFRSDGKIQIEKKDGPKGLVSRLKRSPDTFEALMNTFYPVQDVDPRPQAMSTAAKAVNIFH
jgi:hypothetical protein